MIRIFVEKREEFAVEAAGMFTDLKENLGISSLQSIRILNRYDIEGMEPDVLESAVRTIFSEPNADTVYYEQAPVDETYTVFATELLPGQYDQRTDSAAQCVQLLTQ
ncbi:MAG: hypothetical protein IKI50_00175, partial [Clostridia bacterium]|nr:hypothetical protein [Clostridia bacterium]